MVSDSLYFGTLKLNWFTEIPICWHEQEKSFRHPIITPKTTIPISMTFVSELPKPAGTLLYRNEFLMIYGLNGTEERIYTQVFEHSPSTFSKYENGRVTVSHIFRNNNWYNPNFFLPTMIHLERLLLENEACDLHSCFLEYEGEAILFTAPSGTGKTTQGKLWEKLYNARIINGDKCLLQNTENGFMACGYFLKGSSDACENRALPIRAIAIIRQSKHDYVEELSATQKIRWLYSEITVNTYDPVFVEKILSLLETLIQDTTVLMLHCTPKTDAARVLHQYLYGDI